MQCDEYFFFIKEKSKLQEFDFSLNYVRKREKLYD